MSEHTYEPRQVTTVSKPGSGYMMAMVMLAAAWFALGAGAQYIAHGFGYHPNLGRPLFAVPPEKRRLVLAAAVLCAGSALAVLWLRGVQRLAVPLLVGAVICYAASLGPIYAPIRLLGWSIAYRGRPELKGVLNGGMTAAVAAFAGIGLGAIAMTAGDRKRIASGSHGTARWGKGDELRIPSGFLVGRHDRGELLRFASDGHGLVLAPTGAGKGLSVVIPNLLDHPGSAVVVDIKGENFAVTGRRRREMGQQVVALDPFGIAGGGDALNLLDLIDVKSETAGDDALMLAEMMFIRDPRGESHWNEKGIAFVSGLILHVCTTADEEDRHLPHVRRLAVLHGDAFAELVQVMLKNPAAGGLVAEAAAELMAMPEKERGSVLSTVHKQTRFLSSPAIQRVTGRSTFDLADLKSRRLTVYLILPPRHLDTYKRWLRLMVSASLAIVTTLPGMPAERILFMIDEFQNLDRMEPVLRDYALVRAYGATFWLVVQDIPKLKGVYPNEWETFFDNRSVLQAFGTSGPQTAEYLSKLLGETTILTESESRNQGYSSGKSSSTQRGTGETISEKGRRLLTPDEIINLPPDQQLLFVRGVRPIVGRRLNYLEDPEFTGLAEDNPQHAAAASVVL